MPRTSPHPLTDDKDISHAPTSRPRRTSPRPQGRPRLDSPGRPRSEHPCPRFSARRPDAPRTALVAGLLAATSAQANEWEKRDEHVTVALYCRVLAQAEAPNAPVTIHRSLKQLRDELGLSIDGIRRRRWVMPEGTNATNGRPASVTPIPRPYRAGRAIASRAPRPRSASQPSPPARPAPPTTPRPSDRRTA